MHAPGLPQARAEGRVTAVHAGLKESEKELSVIQKELQDIDHVRLLPCVALLIAEVYIF